MFCVQAILYFLRVQRILLSCVQAVLCSLRGAVFVFTGWKDPFVSQDCRVESFPAVLIEPPLPYSLLDGVLFPVPRENYELQMYLYPDDWHLVSKPVGCG